MVLVPELQETPMPISKKMIVKSCGPLNTKRVILDFFSRIPEVKERLKYILESIQFLHSIGIAHLDIKRDNIICDANGVPKIIDFGASLSLHGENENFFKKLCSKMRLNKYNDFTNRFKEGLLMKIAVHTPGYVSPEFQLCSDILGLQEIEMVKEASKISKKSKTNLTREDRKFLDSLEKNKKQFIIDMFCGTNGNPPALFKSDIYSLGNTFRKMVRDAKIRDSKLQDLIKQMRNPIYSKRPDITECLKHPFFTPFNFNIR